MERPRRLVDDLTQAVSAGAGPAASALLFSILYRHPADVPIELATVVARRYLPIFEARWAGVSWPRELLGDPVGWVGRSGRSVPDVPEPDHPADAAFLLAIDGVLLACAFRDDPVVVTSSCAFAVDQAIEARAVNAWAADDPEAVALWQGTEDAAAMTSHDAEQLVARSAEQNVAAVAVRGREWRHVVDWLVARGLSGPPDSVDRAEIEAALARWQEHDMLLLPPGSG